jgi:hypothetical protein
MILKLSLLFVVCVAFYIGFSMGLEIGRMKG